jgi:hypothetical protein
MQETSTTEVCESSFSFFLGEKVAGKGVQGNTQTREGLQESVRPWFSFTGGRGCASVCLTRKLESNCVIILYEERKPA